MPLRSIVQQKIYDLLSPDLNRDLGLDFEGRSKPDSEFRVQSSEFSFWMQTSSHSKPDFCAFPLEFSFRGYTRGAQGRARQRASQGGRGDALVMARTKPCHMTAAEKAAAALAVEELHASVEAQRAAARRIIQARWASIDPPDE
jgi:hypothetical protein